MNADPHKSDKCCCSKPTLPKKEASTQAQPVSDSSVWDEPWVVGRLNTSVGDVPQIATSLAWADRLGGCKVRWAIGRMRYRVPPGLYAVGSPNDESPVLVTANYKLTFDKLRSQLVERDAWILVLDTKGVNVWCAAAKGTFGTDELVSRVEATGLPALVSHQILIVPQLAAVGVTARDVHTASGFRVMFGPVYAADVSRFLDAGFKSPDMHKLGFAIKDRAVLVPVELMQWATKALIVAVCLLLLAGLGRDGFSLERATSVGVPSAVLFLAVTLSAVILGPILLPWLPGRAFSVKGLSLGLFLAALFVLFSSSIGQVFGTIDLAGWCLAIPAIASFIVMGFTGSTPYTSFSGVRRETRAALPPQIAATAIAIVVWMVGRFV